MEHCILVTLQRLTHHHCRNWFQDVVCPEAVKLDDIDPTAVSANFEKAKNAFNAASAGSIEQAEAQIEMDVNRAMGFAIGVSLS